MIKEIFTVMYSPLSESVLDGWKKELNVMEEKA